jgi:DNA replication and repair protein RecF
VPYLSISYTNFRNIENGTIDLLGKEVYFVGDNGQGKSNILESLYFSAYGNSFRTRNDAEIIRNGENECSIRAIFRDQREHTNSINTFIQDGKKRIEKNAKAIVDRKELVNTIPCVLFSHEDLDFSVGSPDRKRFFIDQSLSMYDSSYIDVLRQYKKILKTRNNLLKDKNTGLLDVVDFQIAEKGLEVIKRRTRTIIDFNRVFARLYEDVSGIGNVTIDYVPSWKGSTIDEILAVLAEKRNLDLTYGTSMSGPHRDHIRYIREKKPFVPTASTGQRRLLSLLLRTAQAQFYTEVSGKKPVLLMDDVMLELDPDKRQKFTALLPEYDQLFCTFLPGEPYERYKRTTTKIYHIEGGRWNE